MQDGELIYRFKKILELMRDVGSRFLSNGWAEFDYISPLFVQRFKNIYPNECKTIEDCTSKILKQKKYNKNDLNLLMDTKNIILSGYKNKEKKIFISHSSEDKEIVQMFVDLLVHIGLNRDRLFCSSIPGFNIRQGSGDIYDYLRSEFCDNNLFVLFMLSQNYYNSVACLNEMGAAWILNNQYQTILLPGFDFADIKGAINPRSISFKLDDKDNRVSAIGEFKNNIIDFLQMDHVDSSIWDYNRERFFKGIDDI